MRRGRAVWNGLSSVPLPRAASGSSARGRFPIARWRELYRGSAMPVPVVHHRQQYRLWGMRQSLRALGDCWLASYEHGTTRGMTSRSICAAGALTVSLGIATALVPGCGGPDWYCIDASPSCEHRLTESDCLAVPGCSFNGGCTSRGCAELTVSSCSADRLCSVSADDCRSRASPCGDILERDSCEVDPDCAWVPGCGGKPTSCREFRDEETCAAMPHCDWTTRSTG